MDRISFLAAAADALQPGDKGYIDYKSRPGYTWRTISHSKVLLNGKGRVIAGAGGKFKGRTWGAKWKGIGEKRSYTRKTKPTAIHESPLTTPAPEPVGKAPLEKAAEIISTPSPKPEPPPFSPERKAAAVWTSDMKAVDKVFRMATGEAWKKATDSMRAAAFEYSQSYSKFNESLRGIEYGTCRYLGVGKIDFDRIGMSFRGLKRGEVKKQIQDLTKLIDSCQYDKDVYLQRGSDFSGLDKFLGIDSYDLRYSSADELKRRLVDTIKIEHAFCSTGAGKGKGFSDKDVQFKIYAPKGTKMLYMEPFAKYGKGAKSAKWDGASGQDEFSDQSEVLLQRGTKFRITDVRRGRSGKLEIDMEIVGTDMQKV